MEALNTTPGTVVFYRQKTSEGACKLISGYLVEFRNEKAVVLVSNLFAPGSATRVPVRVGDSSVDHVVSVVMVPVRSLQLEQGDVDDDATVIERPGLPGSLEATLAALGAALESDGEMEVMHSDGNVGPVRPRRVAAERGGHGAAAVYSMTPDRHSPVRGLQPVLQSTPGQSSRGLMTGGPSAQSGFVDPWLSAQGLPSSLRGLSEFGNLWNIDEDGEGEDGWLMTGGNAVPAAQAAAFGVGGGPFAAGPMQTGMFGTSVCPGAVGQSGNGAASSGQMPTVQVRAPEMHPTGSPFSRTHLWRRHPTLSGRRCPATDTDTLRCRLRCRVKCLVLSACKCRTDRCLTAASEVRRSTPVTLR